MWYDFRFDNPQNRQVRGIGRRELRALFPQLRGRIRSVTLAPPLGVTGLAVAMAAAAMVAAGVEWLLIRREFGCRTDVFASIGSAQS